MTSVEIINLFLMNKYTSQILTKFAGMIQDQKNPQVYNQKFENNVRRILYAF